MPDLLPILNNPAVAQRVSAATARVLADRVEHVSTPAYLPHDLYALLQDLLQTLLPQDEVGTDVDLAAAIDRRLSEGTNAGWRFADLPGDGEAYRDGLTAVRQVLGQRSFPETPRADREEALRSFSRGDHDHAAGFPLSRWVGMLRTDAVKAWLSHPSTMQRLELYGFADGTTGRTDGATAMEGWQAITPDQSKPFEHGSQEEAQA